MIDFTDCPQRNKAYAGSNGGKISVMYDGALYMLKFPPHPTQNKDMSYTNGCISEYLGSHIFASVGIPTQETLLGTFSLNGEKKIVVACKDFTTPGVVLQDFGSLKNQIIDSERNGYGTDLAEIEKTFDEQHSIDGETLRERFWDMFIVDALIGNWDRHNGNWGMLYNTVTDHIELAPVFDCGSSMFPQADEAIMESVLYNGAELKFRIYEIPKSAIYKDGAKINYFKFISSLENEDCNRALLRIAPKIDLHKIFDIVENTPFITDLQKEFFKLMLQERKECIIDYSYNLIQERQQSETKSAYETAEARDCDEDDDAR